MCTGCKEAETEGGAPPPQGSQVEKEFAVGAARSFGWKAQQVLGGPAGQGRDLHHMSCQIARWALSQRREGQSLSQMWVANSISFEHRPG